VVPSEEAQKVGEGVLDDVVEWAVGVDALDFFGVATGLLGV
jgi:hypothetical protein